MTFPSMQLLSSPFKYIVIEARGEVNYRWVCMKFHDTRPRDASNTVSIKSVKPVAYKIVK